MKKIGFIALFLITFLVLFNGCFSGDVGGGGDTFFPLPNPPSPPIVPPNNPPGDDPSQDETSLTVEVRGNAWGDEYIKDILVWDEDNTSIEWHEYWMSYYPDYYSLNCDSVRMNGWYNIRVQWCNQNGDVTNTTDTYKRIEYDNETIFVDSPSRALEIIKNGNNKKPAKP